MLEFTNLHTLCHFLSQASAGTTYVRIGHHLKSCKKIVWQTLPSAVEQHRQFHL